MRDGIFTYRSNISLGKGFAKPWSKVEPFLGTVTNYSSPSRVAIELIQASNLTTQFFTAQKDVLDNKYDICGSNHLGDWLLHQWVIPHSDLPMTIGQYEQLRPLPKQEFGPVIINITVDFELLDPTGNILPFQSANEYGYFVSKDKKAEALGRSRANIYLSENSTMELFICVPFETMCPDLVSQVNFLEDCAPFKLNPKMWKYWEKTKNGKSYKKQKVVLSA